MSRVDDILAQIELTSILPPDLNLRSVGRDKLRGTCPIQEHSSIATFSVSRHADGHQVWQCFACNLRGSVIDLVAALDGITVAAAIRKLSAKNCEPLSRDAILQRSYDSYKRSLPSYGFLCCDVTGCGTVEGIESGVDFAILRAGSSWLWKVSPSGNKAICWKH